MRICGHLPPIIVKLSQPDLVSIMSLLEGNLKEGQVPDKKEPVRDVKKGTTVRPCFHYERGMEYSLFVLLFFCFA